jgi:hypothetical protein
MAFDGHLECPEQPEADRLPGRRPYGDFPAHWCTTRRPGKDPSQVAAQVLSQVRAQFVAR